MSGFSEMCEIIPGLMTGSVSDVPAMVRMGAEVLVPLAFLDGKIWETGFRGEVLYYPIEDRSVLPEDVLHELVDNICARLDEGRKVGLFCGAGHGRTGYVAACVLAKRGIKDPIGYLRRYYSAKAVETDRQANEVFSYVRGLRAAEISKEGLGENFFEFWSYRGKGEFIYLSFSEWDADIAAETVRKLNELGFNVAYDRRILEGLLWDRTRSNMIEDCSLFMTINTPCERNSHIRWADYSFAELLEKPIVFIETDAKERQYYDEEDICSSPEEPDFADKCLKALALKGFYPVPGKKEFDESREGRRIIKRKSEKERKWDLGLVYYEHYGDEERGFKHERMRSCNLRTREAYDWRGNRIEDPTEEELYRAIGWKRVRFDLFPRSDRMDHCVFSDEDREFMRMLCTLGGKPVPGIKEEYKKKQKEIDDYWSSYPYMDEFEYVDSKSDS